MITMDWPTYLSLLSVTGVLAPMLEETVFRCAAAAGSVIMLRCCRGVPPATISFSPACFLGLMLAPCAAPLASLARLLEETVFRCAGAAKCLIG